MHKLAVAAAVAAIAGCRSPTQITVQVSADDGVCTAKLSTEVSVGSLAEVAAGRPPGATTVGCSAGRVGSVVLLPSGRDGDEVAFRVLASIDGATNCEKSFGPGCIEADRALRYIDHESLIVKVPLRVSCEGVQCPDPNTTCANGACVSATIDPSQCEGNGCDEGSLGPPPKDAGIDATVADAQADANGNEDATAGPDATLDADATTDAGSDANDATVPPTIVLALGDEYSCALRLDGTIVCWGDDALGELGIGDAGADVSAVPPTRVLGMPAPMALIGGGANHVCAAAREAGVYCWGDNDYGQLGVDTAGDASGDPLFVASAPSASSLSLGTWQTCAIGSAGTDVHCWGNWGQTTTPGAVIPGTVTPILSLAGGSTVACEATGDAGVFCWGSDNLFVPLDGSAAVVQQAPATEGMVEVSLGVSFVCGRRADGSVACWGYNDTGELGFPSDDQVHGPSAIALPAGRRATHLATGGQFACAILDDGTVACWGRSDVGQCGANAVGAEQDTPVFVPGIANATNLATGTYHACAVLGGTQVVCWGLNGVGQLGSVGSSTGIPQPVNLGL